MSGSRGNLVLSLVEGAVATITLNRAGRHNSLVPDLLAELLSAFEACNRREDLGVVVLRAAGASFSTGGDLHAFIDHADDIGRYAERLVGLLNETIVTMFDSRHPVITAVDGQVTGGALGLVLAADIVVVTERASFRPYYADVGFSPDGGWTALLPQVIGRSRAAAVQLLNREISAQEARDWGLATELTLSADLDNVLADLRDRLLSKRPGGLSSTRRLLRPSDLEARLDEEKRQFVEKITSDAAIAGMRAFIGAFRRGE